MNKNSYPLLVHNPRIGAKTWTNEVGQYHCLDGPAVEYTDGSKYWYQNNLLHRLDGPAVECAGIKFWFVDGKEYFVSSAEELTIAVVLET